MKKIFKLFVSVLAVAALTACGTAVQPNDFKVNPSPLTVVGDLVDADITGTFPVKKFSKKAVLTVTPVLKFNGTEVEGQSVTYVGEKVKENGSIVSYKEGGRFKLHASFAYVPEMEVCELYLRFTAKNGKKVVIIPETKVADGLVTTVKFAVAEDVKSQVTADAFQRIIQEQTEADIHFLIEQSTLRRSELKSQDMNDLVAAIKDADAAENKAINKIEVTGYASPDGKEKLNAGLASSRQSNSTNHLQRRIKNVKADITSTTVVEDWDGFIQYLKDSDIEQKNVLISLANKHYEKLDSLEAAIKVAATTVNDNLWEQIATDILPALRRSRLILTTDLIGKSDEEIAALAQNDPAALNVEELLYAATLTNDLNEKVAIYKKAVAQYGNDYRSHNNLGMIYFAQGKVAEATDCYAAALKLAPKNADVNYNAAIAAMAVNDLKKAEEHLGKAAGTQGDLNTALGTLYTMKGDYDAAKKAFGKSVSNNAAVLYILIEDYAAARQTLANVEKPNATTAYLKAIVCARTNAREDVYEHLAVAVQLNEGLKAKAQNDIEFAKYQAEEEFQAIVK